MVGLPQILTLLLLGSASDIPLEYASTTPQGSTSTTSSRSRPDIHSMTIDDIAWLDKAENVMLGSPIQYVRYDPKRDATNVDDVVYQRRVPARLRKPVVLFVYTNVVEEGEDPFVTLRQAYIIRELAISFKDKIKFVGYDANVDPSKSEDDLGEELGLKCFPSTVLLGLRDFSLKNDPSLGKIHVLDMVPGGPHDNKKAADFKKHLDSWIRTNTQGPERNGIYRFNNFGDMYRLELK